MPGPFLFYDFYGSCASALLAPDPGSRDANSPYGAGRGGLPINSLVFSQRLLGFIAASSSSSKCFRRHRGSAIRHACVQVPCALLERSSFSSCDQNISSHSRQAAWPAQMPPHMRMEDTCCRSSCFPFTSFYRCLSMWWVLEIL